MKEKFRKNYESRERNDLVVEVGSEIGIFLMSLFEYANPSPSKYNASNEFSISVHDHFKDHPLSPEIQNQITNLINTTDSEFLYNASLTFNDPSRISYFIAWTEKHKTHISHPQKLRDQLCNVLTSIDHSLSDTALSEDLRKFECDDLSRRTEELPEVKNRFSSISQFFRVSETTKIILLPTNPLLPQNTGRGFSSIEGSYIIQSHINNPNNQDHEFCHSILNPIVDKMSFDTNSTLHTSILRNAGKRLRDSYGDDPLSLLSEEIVCVYNDYIKLDEDLMTYDNFYARAEDLTEERFIELYDDPNSHFQSRCKAVDITSYSTFREKQRQYFEVHESPTQLQQSIFSLYRRYKNQDKEDFETFFKRHFSEELTRATT